MNTFTIAGEDAIGGFGGLHIVAAGKTIGSPGAICSLAIPAQHWAKVLETHLRGWPRELAHVSDPIDSFHLIHEAYAGEGSGLSFALQVAVGRFVLTNNLGPTFDGFFSIVRPGPEGKVFLVHDQEGVPEVLTIDADEYREQVSQFVARYGGDSGT